ncbi:hypothetical protein DFH09DRAFT_1048537 [Mycena vulgaris]|nr:hypothetical protein DFH09DRAFT_1048537 [Mycena vulgaris]
MDSVFGKSPESWECMLWIRRSTGRLCVELTRPQFDPFFLLTWSMNYISGLTSSLEPPDDSQIIASTPLDVSHGIFALHLGHYRELPISSVQLGVIISCAAGTGIGDSAVIAGILDKMFDDSGWSGNHTELLVMEDGWTRISSSGLEGGTIITRLIWTNYYTRLGWLAQANYLFNRLGITSNYDDYVHVHAIRYQVTLTDTGRIPPGYLCLCPLQDLQSETTSHFWRPACAAYWSLDPSGAEHMSTEEADELGFPRLKFEMWANGWSWDESVYNGIRQFQQAKGYDPYSRDVARELGYPLIHVVSELESCELLKFVPPTVPSVLMLHS